MADKKNGKSQNGNKQEGLQPDPETLHTTDPQENMKGPVSSVMHNIGEAGKKNDKETKQEADEKKDKNT
jgi:hypothetical protein